MLKLRRGGTIGGIRRLGFTLAEILIALALIAILAAVLLPSVAGQIMKGDAGRTMQDLEAVRAGIDQYLADVHRYPLKYQQLTTKIVAGAKDINNTVLPSGLISKWAGPYVTKTLNDAGVLPTGFGGTIQDSLIKTANTNGVSYVTIRILGLDSSAFARLEEQIDGPSATFGVSSSTGILQFVPVSGADTVKYLATPIQ